MKSVDLQDAIRDWDFEVSREAARFIREGVPPYDAIARAVRNISAQRHMGKP